MNYWTKPFFKILHMEGWNCVLAALLLTLLTCPLSGGAVNCYVCSVSPQQLKNSSWIDNCSDGNFTSELVDGYTCEEGCESVTIFDKNEKMESFFRNCAKDKSIPNNNCANLNNRLVNMRVCYCDWNYCNEGAPLSQYPQFARWTLTTAISTYLWTLIAYH